MSSPATSGQILDVASAQELMREVLGQLGEHDLDALQDEAAEKSRRFAALLGRPEEVAELGPERVRAVLRSVFTVRRRADAVLAATGPERLADLIAMLLHGDGVIEERFGAFCAGVGGLERGLAADLASELLHFTFPGRWWLWTRWVWDPEQGTGALRLVTTSEYDLSGPDAFQTYLRVGKAIAFVEETGRAAGLQPIGRGPFGVDVLLACVYGVYLYTVLRLRMTREFNRVVPPLPQLARRLLGIHGREV